MRIVLDLQICQSPAQRMTAAEAALEEALALVRLATEGTHPHRHELWIALAHRGNRDSVSIETVRCAFDGLIARSKIVVYELPDGGADAGADAITAAWQARANEHIRENFLATLNPDLVFVANLHDTVQEPAVFSIGAQSAGFITVVRVADATLAPLLPMASQRAEPGGTEHQYRLQASLKNAAQIFTGTAAGYKALAASYPCVLPQVTQLSDSAASVNAARMQDKIETTLAMLPKTDIDKKAIDKAAIVRNTSGQQRPRLAYISPLPPEKSGIADYSAELIPELAHYYEIDVIVDQAALDVPWISAHLPLKSVAWFESHADQYERVLYHFGNSPMHKHMFGLFERHPGMIVLHDFFLGNVLDHLDYIGYMPGAFLRALYLSHGWPALLDRKQVGAVDAVWKYPCNKTLIDQASGVIVHSAYPTQLARQWYGADTSTAAPQHWRTLPLLRGKPGAHDHDTAQDQAAARLAARTQLGLAQDAFVICSFGMLGQTKFNQRLLDAWLASPLAQHPQCRLIFVGENDPGPYGKELARSIAASPCGKRIGITGFVSHPQYCSYLAATDGAVQLRTQSRGETSAAVLDCLLHGVPTIVNAHGSSAELPPDVLHMLAEDCPQDALSAALMQFFDDAGLRDCLAQRARAYMQAEHSPRHVGLQYQAAIEHFATQGPNRQYRQLIDAISRISNVGSANTGAAFDRALHGTAAAIAANQPVAAPRQLFIDISAMVQLDLKTGIQRVVRSVMMALLGDPPDGYRIEPVYCRGDGSVYRYARQYMFGQLDVPPAGLDDAPLEIRAGDLFLGIDLFMGGTTKSQARLQAMRNRGVELYFVVYDILPLLRPDVFPMGAEADFGGWLQTITGVADGIVCISRAVADELATWLGAHPTKRQAPLQLGYFHLGADIDASAPSFGMPSDADAILAAIRAQPSMLMVGTLEPRKGHAQTLSAFESLWQQGENVNLVIVGKHGWMVDALASRLRNHPENGKRLFWLEGTSDEMLLAVYQSCSVLLAASEGEGFGLPLIEAAQHQLPIIARELPVFREVAGDHAFYFDGLEPASLAKALLTWLQLYAAGSAPGSKGMQWLNWEQSAQQLQDAILRHQWYRTILAGKDYNAGHPTGD